MTDWQTTPRSPWRSNSSQAQVIRDYRYEINCSDTPANDDGAGDVAIRYATVADTMAAD